MGKELQKAIVLGGDNGYMDKIETTIKSICAHNRAVTFYIFNDDLPSEWFQLMERRLEPLASKIVNVKISHQGLKGYSLPLAHLSYATFFRYFIPQFVSEDLALYLDSDIIVRSNLDELFLKDMADWPVAAVADALVPSTFNAGVLLINVALWRQEKVTEHLLSLTDQLHDQVFGDQGVLNHLFEGRWKPLPATYNFMVGMDTVARNYQMDSWYSDSLVIEKTAQIIHYTGDKPWYQINLNRFREDWWFYYGLEWSDIVMKKCDFHKGFASLVQNPQYATAIFTNTCHIERIEYLIQELPDVEFSILAHTNFAPEIMNLQSHLNVRLYPYFNPMNVKKVLEKIDFYLDINHEDEIANIIQEVQQREIPIFAFETTSHDPSGCSQVYSPAAVDEMIEYIRTLLKSKKQSM